MMRPRVVTTPPGPRACGAVIVVLAALLAAPARADQVLVTRAPAPVSPRFAEPGGVVWARNFVPAGRANDHTQVLHATVGGQPQVIFDDPRGALVGRVAASAGLVAITGSTAGFAGPPTGPLSEFWRGAIGGPWDVDVDDERMAFTPGDGRVVVEGSDGLRRSVAVVDSPRRVRLAGRFVAWEDVARCAEPTVTVRDLEADRAVYRIREPNVARFDDCGWEDWDLGADGTVAAIEEGRRSRPRTTFPQILPGRLVWFSARDPSRHDTGLATTPFSTVTVAGGRIAFARDLGHGQSTLSVLDPATGALTEVARFDKASRDLGGFDFDGTRMLWAQAGCHDDESSLVEDDTRRPADPAAPVAVCGARVSPGHARMRAGRLALRVVCLASKGMACHADVVLRLARSLRPGVRSVRPVVVGRGRVRVPFDHSRALTVAVSRRLRSLLARYRAVHVMATAKVRDDQGQVVATRTNVFVRG